MQLLYYKPTNETNYWVFESITKLGARKNCRNAVYSNNPKHIFFSELIFKVIQVCRLPKEHEKD